MVMQAKEISGQKKRKGVLTVEAAIILPIFIMVMFFILSIMKLFYFHLVMQQALQNVGRTLAQYGYVIDDVIGLQKFTMSEETKEVEGKLKQDASAAIESSKKLIQEVQDSFSGKASGFGPDKIGDFIDLGKDFGEKIGKLAKTLKSLKAVNGKIIVNYLFASAMNEVGGVFVEWMIGDYLDSMQASNGTITNIKYSLYVDARAGEGDKVSGTKDIILVVDYDYSLDFFFFDKVRIRQAVRVHPWTGGGEKVWK